jgi:hypothetical protein
MLQDVLSDRYGKNIVSRAESMKLKSKRDEDDFER